MPPNPEHSSATSRLNRRLTRALPDPWLVRCQDPIHLGPVGVTAPRTEPEPDVFVIQGPEAHGITGLVNLYGIESPGLTASLAIAERVRQLIGGATSVPLAAAARGR